MGNLNKLQATTAPSQSEIDVADAEVGGRMATMLGWRGSLQSILCERMQLKIPPRTCQRMRPRLLVDLSKKPPPQTPTTPQLQQKNLWPPTCLSRGSIVYYFSRPPFERRISDLRVQRSRNSGNNYGLRARVFRPQLRGREITRTKDRLTLRRRT